MADCHLGAWRDTKLRDVNKKYFSKAVDLVINEKVDFMLIAGDLFNTAVPGIESIKLAVEQLKKLKDNNIPVYFIAGSHDFSPSGKTMLDVLEKAELGINAAKYDVTANGKFKLNIFVDKKTNVGIVGMIGKRGGLEKSVFHNLETAHFKNHDGFKIFMFHSAINEIKPKELEAMESFPLDLLPKGFDYYAGGHVHIVNQASIDGYNVVLPGPVFPNTFYELEKLKKGGFFIVEDKKAKFIELNDFPVVSFVVDCNDKAPSEVEDELKELISGKSFEDSIITLRLKGKLLSGRPSDINLNDIVDLFHNAGAYVVLKNTAGVSVKGFEAVKIELKDVADVEEEIINQHSKQNDFDDNITKSLIKALSAEKHEGEKQLDYEKRLFADVDNLLVDVVNNN